MSGSVPVSPTAAYVDMTGIHAPTFTEVRDYLVSQFQFIYGSDIVVDESTQDGQLIGVFALAIADANAACIQVYNSFSPSTAQGVGLSRMVKINGLARALPSNSMVVLQIIGTAGTVIINGVAMDAASNRWRLPPSVIIPPTGLITVSATAEAPGAIIALPDTIVRIATVTRGWQEVTNPFAATPGAPVETDPQLRVRQSQSTADPSVTVLSGITGAVLALPGVTAAKPYENDTSATDPLTTLPPHSIALVVQGGDATAICQTILMHKTPGCFTYGTVRENVEDAYGLPHDIGYFIPVAVPIAVAITLIPKPGYTTNIGRAISRAVSDYINAMGSGEAVVYSKLWLPANLCDLQGMPIGAGETYDITELWVGLQGGTLGVTNIPITIAQVATCTPLDVVITVA